MKTDIDSILEEANLDGLLVVGPAMRNASMVYLTGGGHVTNADLIIKRGRRGTLFHGPMERDEAAKTGLEIRSYSNYPFQALLEQAEHNRTRALALRYQKMFTDSQLTSGRVGLAGKIDAGSAWEIFNELQTIMPELQLVGNAESNVLQKAMATKDEDEVARIRKMGQVTTRVVGNVADYLSAQAERSGVVVSKDGQPVTIGKIKQMINLWLAELGVENPEGTIFAIGRDAAVPHSSGMDDDLIRTGQTIVFDIFPCEPRGGYYYDMTRTWCVGYAPDEVLALYEQVKEVYLKITGQLKTNALFRDYQRMACEYYEAMGHPTILQNPATEQGYVHGLGHGVGLFIHERPSSATTPPSDDLLEPGSIFTIEPGLYYPDRGMGVRIEDTYWARPDGGFEKLADYPIDLVLPLKG